MDYLNDLTVFCLAVAMPLGGLVLGRRLGPAAACWMAGGLFLSLRFADRLWRTVFIEMREADKALSTEFWLPMSFVFLILGLLFFVLGWIGLVRPGHREFALPARAGEVVAMVAGGLGGLFLILAIVQSQAMLPESEKRLSRSLGIARPVLASLGQKHIAPAQRPAAPKEPQKTK